MAGNPWQPHHAQYPQRSPAHEEERAYQSLQSLGPFGQVEDSQVGGLRLSDPCLIRDDCDEQVEPDNRLSQTQLQRHQMQPQLAENEQQELAGSEQNRLVPRNQRRVDLEQLVRSESPVECGQAEQPAPPHVPVHTEPPTSNPVPLQALHSCNNGHHGQPPCLQSTRQGSDTCRRLTRRDMAMLTAPPSGEDEQQPEVVIDEYIVPILPIPMAIACCLMNFAVPGLGTMVAGMCMPCCGDAEEMSRRRKLSSGAAVVGVGFLQLLLTACFLVGWVWSAIWGLSLVGTSLDYYEKPREVSSWRNRVNSAHSQSNSTCACFSRPLGSGRRQPRSNFIYPMRAPSDIDRDSPPPPYVMFATPPPSYSPPTPADGVNSSAETPPTQNLPEANEAPNLRSALRCGVCQKDFVTEDHRFACRRCTDIVCRQCYTKQIPFQGGDYAIVCDVCYHEHLEMEAEMEDNL
ncbi:uncharacterized protein LOC110456038 [Mizuhopecten yessoensis]|uniref:Protein SPEC3 n=1 Tax=Mizuhopecten yessoensis TaxID=6573 RepID=A0A210R3Y2_MIZYE|nr:uncharacterized protein LOC110456038 [Mizuhopecten yessoensis]OWF55709.1 Protein SPEC3 [Mizuhopecten yessoensis]